MFEIIGKITVGFVALIVLGFIVYNLYNALRAAVYATDFLRWYIAQSKKTDPTYSIKTNIISAWGQAFREVYGYNSSVKITHNNGAVYRPFAKV